MPSHAKIIFNALGGDIVRRLPGLAGYDPVIIPATRLLEDYSLAIENAMRSFGAPTDLLGTFPDKALALAQIGQEEVGKSLTLLAAFALPQTPNAWT